MNQQNVTSSRETVYFVLAIIFSVLVYVIAAISIIGIGIALFIFAFMFFVNMMMLGSIRGNGVRISQNQFPDVYERVKVMSEQMGLQKVPDVFVIQSEGILNAFATRFWGRNMVVLYSEIFDLGREQGKDELDFIIAHELSHVKRRHVWKNILIAPAQFIPFLAQAYSRSCEYTCDREAAFIINNAPAAKRALTILSVGKQVYREVNEDAFVEQISTESHGVVWVSEILSSHPNLPKRIQSVSVFMGETSRPIYTENAGKVVAGVLILGAATIGAYFAIIGSVAGGTVLYGTFLTEMEEEFSDYEEYESTNLMDAVSEADIDEVNRLIELGVDFNEQDYYGNTALHHATIYEYPDIIEVLLKAGADPNIINEDEATPIIEAVYYADYESALLLLDFGADPEIEDIYGSNALNIIGVETEEELREALTE
ncbi:M48 family metallopeptidase [Alkalicoccobacillus murimartini]|uniref:Zn-dependent protease with chaperone function n=1 Tax=Alkalicoccobacillus murimartini TaxID=171685 RepID=A0ABT9YHT2_9BACI|nr:M48 family metallopeptidase [Alkalicoccobacillus murimartini]MDQ0207266.1 Zn-dependent protease with chaperone function [Alkalicoccobacillus murimartini]